MYEYSLYAYMSFQLNIGLNRQLKALDHLLLTNTSSEKQLFYYLYERWQKNLPYVAGNRYVRTARSVMDRSASSARFTGIERI